MLGMQIGRWLAQSSLLHWISSNSHEVESFGITVHLTEASQKPKLNGKLQQQSLYKVFVWICISLFVKLLRTFRFPTCIRSTYLALAPGPDFFRRVFSSIRFQFLCGFNINSQNFETTADWTDANEVFNQSSLVCKESFSARAFMN